MSQIDVSVVVPAYQAARFVADALTSIRHQDVDVELEVIVVDDGSTDGTGETVAATDPHVRVIEQANAGPAAARNTGIAQSAGHYLAFLDADDLWPTDSLRHRLEHLDAHPNAAGVMGKTAVFAHGSDGGGDDEPFGPPVFGAFLGATLLRRRVVERVGPLDETLRVGEDLDYLARIREAAPLLLTERICHRHRRHDRNSTIGVTRESSNVVQVVKASLDRRRAETGHARPLPSFGDGAGEDE